MKNLLLILILSFTVVFSAHAQSGKSPVLKFTYDQHDLGTIFIDNITETKLDIEFSNTGEAPLLLSAVRACCGTRVVSWPRDPIMPGQKGTIKVEFRLPPRVHRISRTVTVTSNDTANPVSIYRLIGQVADRASTPPQ